MNKKDLFIAVFAFLHFYVSAENVSDSTNRVNQTQIDVVYNHYMQDGNNSAVTGGTGTELLTVFAPAIGIRKKWKNHALKFNLGADVISSASTDRIDFVMSSASSLDAHGYLGASYEYTFLNKQITLYGGSIVSMESDFFSIGYSLGWVKQNKRLAQYAAELQIFNDDLRWGRLAVGKWKPETLIYPVELRGKEWYRVYKRHSYNLKLSYSQPLGKRTLAGVYPMITYQYGLLATPFHRIYFKDNSMAVEQLPNERLKASLGLQLNQFVGGRLIFKNTINPFIDSWGILSLAVANETAIKITPKTIISPNFRFQTQRGTDYFAPYKAHEPDAKFYTSDYDLATNQTYNIGLGLKVFPYKQFSQTEYFEWLVLRYNFLNRSDGLTAHIISLSMQIERRKVK